MNAYKWNCRDVEVYTTYSDSEGNTEPLVIFKVNWKILVCDEIGNATTISGIEELEIKNLNNFTSFENVTNNEVTGWVKASMGESGVEFQEQNADSELDKLINPTTQTLHLIAD